MMIKTFAQGTGSGRGAVNYLLDKLYREMGLDDRPTGRLLEREPAPEVMAGDPVITQNVISSITRKWKYTSGVISFHLDDTPTEEQQRQIMAEFESVAFAGMDSDQTNILWVRHTHTEGGRVELHFVIPRTELTTGKAFNPTPPNQMGAFNALREKWNFANGWADPSDAGRERVTSQERGKPKDKRELEQFMETALVAGEIQTRQDVIRLLESVDAEITRTTRTSVSVKMPDQKKPWRLSGAMYAETFNAKDLAGKNEAAGKGNFRDRSQDEAKSFKASKRLAELTARRADFNSRHYPRNPDCGKAPDAPPAMDAGDSGQPSVRQYLRDTLAHDAVAPARELQARPVGHNTHDRGSEDSQRPAVADGTATSQPEQQTTNAEEVTHRGSIEERNGLSEGTDPRHPASRQAETPRSAAGTDRKGRVEKVNPGRRDDPHSRGSAPANISRLQVMQARRSNALLSSHMGRGNAARPETPNPVDDASPRADLWQAARQAARALGERLLDVGRGTRRAIISPAVRAIQRCRQWLKGVANDTVRNAVDASLKGAGAAVQAGHAAAAATNAAATGGHSAASFANANLGAANRRLDPACGGLAVKQTLKQKGAEELDRFKTGISLPAYAQSQGYELVKAESSAASFVMRKGDDKIVISTDESDGHGVYFSVRDDADQGSIVDFVQKRKGLHLGDVRKELRPWIGKTAEPTPAKQQQALGKPKAQPRSHAAIAAQLAGITSPLEGRHHYLQSRGISAATVASFGRAVRIDGRGNAIFPHYNAERLACGYEIKNAGFTGFAAGGARGVWLSPNFGTAKDIAVVESAIDALSLAELEQDPELAYISLGGALGGQQAGLVADLMQQAHQRGQRVLLATDADPAGDKLAQQLQELAPQAERLRPPEGMDWNDELAQQLEREQHQQQQQQQQRNSMKF